MTAGTLVSVVGARPQFIKLGPVARALDRRRDGAVHLVVHTGQHYDAGMSDVFFEELGIPPATVNLGVGSGPHGRQTGQMLERLEAVLLDIGPDMVVAYGDTNSTIAAALAAAKLHIPIAHVEAGLRSFDRGMSEEVNRVVADHVSSLLLAPTKTAMDNLRDEGLSGNAVLTGDVMYDAVLFNFEVARRRSRILERLGLTPGAYGVMTVHRAENTDDRERLGGLLAAFAVLPPRPATWVFPMHPRTAQRVAAEFPAWVPGPRLRVIEPIGYLDMLGLLGQARITLTDSGGLQKEAFFLGCPCVTLRERTEWVETVQAGGNVLAGVDGDKIALAVSAWEDRRASGAPLVPACGTRLFGDGAAADRVADALLAFPRQKAGRP